jgi:SAM-dependent methyltransferase
MREDTRREMDVSRAAWQLPAGVSRGAWDYVTHTSIATEYDQFHKGHPLLQLDRELVDQHLGANAKRPDGSPKLAIDFGCGTGRNLLPLAERGWRVIGVDLSSEMLSEFKKKAIARSAAIRVNMAQLSCFAAGIADAILCMYSSIGMIQGRTHRRSFMEHAGRVLRPDGMFFVHVHNRGSWLRDPGGVRKTVRDWARTRTDKTWELGDSVYAYRGLPSMFLHIYSERELRQDIAASGMVLERVVRLNRTSSQWLRGNWMPHLRSGGFIAVCRPPKLSNVR